MNRQKFLLLSLGLIVVSVTVGILSLRLQQAAPDAPAIQRIAHAGSGWNKMVYTNSLEALDSGYAKGFRIFEIDLLALSEGEVVCLHDFSAFQQTPDLPTFFKWRSGLPFTPCTLNELKGWLTTHPDSYLMTDIKNAEAQVLERLLTDYSDLKHRLIVQIYDLQGYAALRDRGVEHVLWTLYRLPPAQRHAEYILNALGERSLWAITLPAADAQKGLAQALGPAGIPILAHTINQCEQAQSLFKLGVDEIYSDWLAPDACAPEKPAA